MSDTTCDSDFDAEKDEANSETVQPNKAFRSKAWKYFKNVDGKQRVAMCLICHKKFNYKSTVTNLVKHVKRMHGIFFAKSDNLVGSTFKEDHNPIWAHFRQLDGIDVTTSECNHCLKRISHPSGTAQLRSHIRKHHPEFDVDCETNHDQKFKVASDQNIKCEDVLPGSPIYLEEFHEDINNEPNQKARKRKIINNNFSNDNTIQANNSSSINNNTLDLFGKYLLSILGKLPENTSLRLQSTFITAALDAAAKHEQQIEDENKTN